jgi:hypothetical protein
LSGRGILVRKYEPEGQGKQDGKPSSDEEEHAKWCRSHM